MHPRPANTSRRSRKNIQQSRLYKTVRHVTIGQSILQSVVRTDSSFRGKWRLRLLYSVFVSSDWFVWPCNSNLIDDFSIWWSLWKDTSAWWSLRKDTSVWWSILKDTSASESKFSLMISFKKAPLYAMWPLSNDTSPVYSFERCFSSLMVSKHTSPIWWSLFWSIFQKSLKYTADWYIISLMVSCLLLAQLWNGSGILKTQLALKIFPAFLWEQSQLSSNRQNTIEIAAVKQPNNCNGQKRTILFIPVICNQMNSFYHHLMAALVLQAAKLASDCCFFILWEVWPI
jgi:hypothetical protein